MACLLFEVLAQGVINSAGTSMPHREEQEWNQQLHEALNSILSSSYMCCPQMLRTVLHLMINNDVRTNPESLTAGKGAFFKSLPLRDGATLALFLWWFQVMFSFVHCFGSVLKLSESELKSCLLVDF